ncbi:phosphatase PAP2 family protein [Alistipes sp. ZOR0009]|uniref:phosphatase PAP2 family protein n=1 Tax=Alistipes sp. ZOR0009 TaxID=1339253 RepID=UPI000689EFD7|nr:phosphatase PAP2 family protein [Alistipes sp. ZOR0009]
MKAINSFQVRFWVLFLLAIPALSHAQYADRYERVVFDTTKKEVRYAPLSDPFRNEPLENSFQRITTSRAFQISYIPIGLFTFSALASKSDDYVHSARNYNVPNFSYRYDDYLQYAPGVLTYGLKALGVDGRSSWGRLATSTAFSSVVMGITVNTLKGSVSKRRPDGSANNSFPSGHTTMAFMMATWLHKEYGVTRSPLYSIFGYATATSIAMGRVMNNKHWLSDVVAGAGLGILSTNLGYYFGDLIYRDKGISSRAINQALPPTDFRPSFWNISSGYSILNSLIELDKGTNITLNPGFCVSTEGAWFLNSYVGLGAKFSVNTSTLSLNQSSFLENQPLFKDQVDYIQPGSMSVVHFFVGPYFSYPISRRFYLNTKLIGGYASSSASEIVFVKKIADAAGNPEKVVGYKSKKDSHWGFETGVAAVTMVSRSMGLRFFADYSVSVARPRYAQILDINAGIPSYSPFKDSHDATQNLVVGIGINAFFD